MPSKKKKYNARFPAGRIKKIMQSDEEIGKVAQAVPVIISRTLELFVESLLTKTLRITNSRSAKTLSPSHMKQCIMSEQRFDFLKEVVRNIPDISVAEEAACNYNDDELHSSPEEPYPDSDTPYDLSLPSTSMRALPNGNNNAFARSQSLNGGGGVKRQHQQQHPPPTATATPSVILTPAHMPQQHALGLHLPIKLARSESTPAYMPRGRPPSTAQHQHHSRQSRDTAIPLPPICKYELNKPIVKIDYSNMPLSAATAAASEADCSAPIINIDLSNIVAAGATGAAPRSESNNNSQARISSSTVNHIAGSSSAPFIPKATLAAPLNETFFELDEDYDNI